jgi:hypothetical protein
LSQNIKASLLNRVIRKSARLLKRGFGVQTEPETREPKPKMQIWSIGIYSGESPLAMSPAPNIQNPVLTGDSVRDAPAAYVADPFMIKVGGAWHMFFEVFNSRRRLGEIGLATSYDMIRWNYRKIVLREPFHLSFPYVFEWQNEYYMIPESYQAKSVRLYRATNFPVGWVFVDNLIVGDDFEDNCVFRFDDRWWLLNDLSRTPYYAGTLRLFCSEHLTGPWIEHPKSPVINGDPHKARPAGRVLVWNDKVIRFTQDCCPVYGIQVRAFELTELTTTTFQEQEVPTPVLQGSGTGWNESGMHHIDPHLQDDGKWIACVDGWHWDS